MIQPSKAYRSDIDGLRAIAVVAVVLYHVRVGFIPGGFVGVDVFFVISGYLITGIVFDDVRRGRFSLAGFYDRRVRRIFPALFAMLLAATLGAALLLLPSELTTYAGSLAAATFFWSNGFFAAHSGYFDAGARATPLLHTWSLAVEEQFYLLFPLVLAFTYRRFPRALTVVIAVAAVASFAYSAFGVQHDPQRAFYSSPGRAWELLLGALLALGFAPRVTNPAVLEAAGAGGLAAILGAVVLYHDGIPFPGPSALLPTAGAALLLWSGAHRTTWAARLLGTRPMVFVGLISYSLYLWHWPLIVFSRFALEQELTKPEKAFIILASFVLASLSWHYVERPWRTRRAAATRRRLAISAVAAMGTALAAAVVVMATAGWPDRFPAEAKQMSAFAAFEPAGLYRQGKCFLMPQSATPLDASCVRLRKPGPNVLLLGDSHAADLWDALTHTFPKVRFLQATAVGCKPVLGGASGVEPCHGLMQRMLTTFVARQHPQAVLLSADWRQADLPPLLETIRFLRAHGTAVVVFGIVPEYEFTVPRLLAMRRYRHDRRNITHALLPGTEAVDRAFTAALAGSGARYVSFYRFMCNATCETVDARGAPLQFDRDHFTASGARWIAGRMRQAGLIAFDVASCMRVSRPARYPSRCRTRARCG